MAHFPHHYEENYLKALYKLSLKEGQKVNNIALAKYMDLNPASVLEMVRKMSDRELVLVQRDKTILLTVKGSKKALQVIRRHRLWEVFLVQKLKYRWNEVHELAEQLEHIESDDLVNRLDGFLGYPAADPHGDPIPDAEGLLQAQAAIPLFNATPGNLYCISRFGETEDSFLDYLEKMQLLPGTEVVLEEMLDYDQSCGIRIGKRQVRLTEKAARNILVQPVA